MEDFHRMCSILSLTQEHQQICENRTEVLQTAVRERLNDGGENLLRPFVRLFVFKASSYYDYSL